MLSIVGLGSLLFGIIEGPAKGWNDPLVLAAFAVGTVAVASFIAWELHTPTPMLDMRFFQNPRFTAANSAITLTFFAMFGSMFLMTQYWQFVHGYSPLGAGLRMIPYALTMMVVAPMSARVVERVGTKRVVTTGLLVVSIALLALSFLQPDTPYPVAISGFCLMAAGMGMTMAPATESVMGSLPREKAGVGSAVNDTTRQVGGALGVAVIGSVVSSVYADQVTGIAARYGVTGDALAQARGSLGGALEVGSGLGASCPDVHRRGRGRLRRGAQQRTAPQQPRHPRRGLHRLALPPGAGPRPAGRRRPPRGECRRGDRRARRRALMSAGADPVTAGAAPAPRRGRPRRADADEAILRATLEQLADAGVAGLSMDLVAQRAGVGKATIYRRWTSKEELVLEALRTVAAPIPVPDEGSLRGDLIAYTDELVERFSHGRGSDVLPHLVAASCHDAELRASLDAFTRGRQATLRRLFARGVERGELPADTDIDLAVDAILGPIFYRHLLSGEPVDRALARRLVDLALR